MIEITIILAIIAFALSVLVIIQDSKDSPASSTDIITQYGYEQATVRMNALEEKINVLKAESEFVLDDDLQELKSSFEKLKIIVVKVRAQGYEVDIESYSITQRLDLIVKQKII
jgi:hypothetical protein